MCLRGASAVADMLNRHPEWKLRVFVVWEPIRGADKIGPAPGTYARIPDRRVRQFWDRDRLLSRRIVRDALENPTLLADSARVTPNTIIWDVAAVFPAGSRWGRSMPRPAYYGMPVAEVAGDVEQQLAAIVRPSSTRR